MQQDVTEALLPDIFSPKPINILPSPTIRKKNFTHSPDILHDQDYDQILEDFNNLPLPSTELLRQEKQNSIVSNPNPVIGKKSKKRKTKSPAFFRGFNDNSVATNEHNAGISQRAQNSLFLKLKPPKSPSLSPNKLPKLIVTELSLPEPSLILEACNENVSIERTFTISSPIQSQHSIFTKPLATLVTNTQKMIESPVTNLFCSNGSDLGLPTISLNSQISNDDKIIESQATLFNSSFNVDKANFNRAGSLRSAIFQRIQNKNLENSDMMDTSNELEAQSPSIST